jgi:hypothetical protein
LAHKTQTLERGRGEGGEEGEEGNREAARRAFAEQETTCRRHAPVACWLPGAKGYWRKTLLKHTHGTH